MKRLALVLLTLVIAIAAEARIGGGDSYAGSDSSSSSSSSSSDSSWSSSSDSDYSSSSSGGSSSGGDDSPAAVIIGFLFMGFMLLTGVVNAATGTKNHVLTVAPSSAPAKPSSMAPLRELDPNFSEIVFTDFCYSLFGRLYEALGRGRLDDLAPYVSAPVRAGLKQHAAKGLTDIDGIVIGGFSIREFQLGDQDAEVEVEFEANYTEVAPPREPARWYVREAWTLTRKRDLLSPRPENAKAEHCPKCAAPLATRTDGACLHCGTVIDDGSFQWFVESIEGLAKESRPPQLGGGGSGPEPGLDRATVIQPWIARHMAEFVSRNAGFTWESFDQRVREVATQLQHAWTSRDWKLARPLETDALFQMHRYWIDEYSRQRVRNVVDDYTIDMVDVAKVTSDAFFDAITVRLYASGRDYTVNDATGVIIGGSPRVTKQWSEYWTFVRGRSAAPAGARACPNCGGKLAEGQTAVCEYCGGKVTSGEFPWILSKIEQDEAYRGRVMSDE